MSNAQSVAPGWYPDEETGGTRYWDGWQWSSSRRPARKPFAARSAHRGWGIALTVIGAMYVLGSPAQFNGPNPNPDLSPVGNFILVILLGLGFIAWGIYLLRGQGPTTKSVLAKLAPPPATQSPQPAQVAPQRDASLSALHDYPAAQTININLVGPTAADYATAAQINALANPETAEALSKLQNLLYTRTISDEEFQAVKQKLLGDH